MDSKLVVFTGPGQCITIEVWEKECRNSRKEGSHYATESAILQVYHVHATIELDKKVVGGLSNVAQASFGGAGAPSRANTLHAVLYRIHTLDGLACKHTILKLYRVAYPFVARENLVVSSETCFSDLVASKRH